jgi:alcohol dehydrogenase class IV
MRGSHLLGEKIGRIQSPKIIRIGGGVAKEIVNVLKQLSLSNPLIVTDQNLQKLGHLDLILNILDKNKISYGLFSDVVEDPTDACVDAGLHVFKSAEYDCIIGLGGGSPMDTAKAISFMSVNAGHVRNYKAPAQIDVCGPPVILIPTTGGTGSELTRWCVITDTKNTEKYNLSGLACVATAALIDWTFTTTKPWRITADTAVDSLTHAIEAYVSIKAFDYTDAFALAAMPAIVENVRLACKEPENPTARKNLMLAASQAGMAFSNSSVALVHGMSRPIGAHFHVAHGLSNAMLLPKVTEFSISGNQERYATCARAMKWAKDKDSHEVACSKLVENLYLLNDDLKVPSPTSLGHSADNDMFRLMASQALASGSPQNNPRVPTKNQIIQIYEEVWG